MRERKNSGGILVEIRKEEATRETKAYMRGEN
jgi:hypothetical protein